MRTPLIAGNWKMHNTRREATDLVKALTFQLADIQGVEIAVAPPFTALETVAHAVEGTVLHLAAQHVFWTTEGAYTGEISPRMLKDLGCRYVIIGHSERRRYFGETDKSVGRRLTAVLGEGMRPICCVGETLEEREQNHTFGVIETQLREGLKDVATQHLDELVIAYEPVWAIGTGKTARPEQANEVHTFIRGVLSARHGETAGRVRILYGGSVTPENISALMAEPEIDGALVGGASLKADAFASIVRYRRAE